MEEGRDRPECGSWHAESDHATDDLLVSVDRTKGLVTIHEDDI